jgi:hypothetical protein
MRLILDCSNQYSACTLSPMLGDNEQACKPWRQIVFRLDLRLGQKTRSDRLAVGLCHQHYTVALIRSK